MSDTRETGFLRKGWRNVREAGTQRLLLTGLLLFAALGIGIYSWSLPISANAERALYDTRLFYEADDNPAEPDPRVLMVVYNDQTLIEARKRSPLDRGILANALRNLDAMEPAAIGIDILFDQPQDEDAQLIDTLRSMQTPVSVAYANMTTNEGDIVYDQQQYLEEFLGMLEGSKSRPASIRLDDEYGVTRRFPVIEDDLPPVLGRDMLEASLGADAGLPGYEGAIRYRLPAAEGVDLVTKLPITLFTDPELAPAFADEVAGKYVLIGGDITDYDRVATPLSEIMDTHQPPGLQVHAEMLTQMLDGQALVRPPAALLAALTVLFVIMAVLTGLLEWNSWRIYPIMLLQFAVLVGVPIVYQFHGVDTFGVPAFGWVVAWIIAFAAVTSAARASGAVQRNFAQGALGKYLPKEMAEEIIENPQLLALHGEKKQIYVLFSDLEGFTKMSHAIEPEMVAKLLNRYLEMLSQVVLDHGGVIDKFVGDAVVAFWGAPIARENDAERAAHAGYAIWQAGEAFRAEVAAMDPDLPKIGKTRVGLHYGDAVVGNFGGETRIQYTALGDSMNTAARLEAANKALESSVMASREFAERSGLDWWRAMGRVRLRGRARAVDIMEPAPDFPEADRARLNQAVDLIDTDVGKARLLIRAMSEEYPNDTALQNLLKRLDGIDDQGVFSLG